MNELTRSPIDSRRVLLGESRLIVCVGSGGVGKTTAAAAVALRAALGGRRVLVLTIDPAKRLANAMGLDELDNAPRRVDLSPLGVDDTGELDAMMLDAISSFDELIRSTAGDDADEILQNRVYRMMVDHFAGVQEYMAVVRLFDVYESGEWDLIVLDTPPAKHAVDFFSASKKASLFFDERIMRWFLPEMNRDSGFFKRVFNPGAIVLRLLALIGGETFIAELTGFFSAMSKIREDLKHRGDRVDQILRDDLSNYIVIASPDPRRVDEAVDFHDRLRELRKQVALFVLNKSHDRFAASDLDALDAAIALTPDDDQLAATAGRVHVFYRELLALAGRDRGAADTLARRVANDRVRLVPVFGQHIHTLEQLRSLSDYIFGAG